MLREAISIVKRSGTVQLATIARELEVSEQLARQILDELTRLGYLHVIVTKEAFVACKGCPMRSACLYQRQPQIWVITTKGQRLISEY